MRAMSAKRSAREAEYREARDEFLVWHRECEIAIEGLCSHRATQVHHVVNRSQAYWLVADVRIFAATCGECHEFVTAHPAWAKAHGWTYPSMDFLDYERVPCSHEADGHVWVRWEDNGLPCLSREEWVMALSARMIERWAGYDAIGHANGRLTDNRLANFVVLDHGALR